MEKESLSILIIDPDTNDHNLINLSFKNAGIPTIINIVTNTNQGLEILKENKFDLILTNHQIPQANAFQLLYEVQQEHSETPVVLMTNEKDPRIVREAFHRGMDDFLLKEELPHISLFDLFGNLIEKKHKAAIQNDHQYQLKEQAERDGLTGLYNHRYLVDALEREFARAKRYHRPLSILMCDLDGFKTINDTCGHPQGDKVLIQVAHLLLQTVRFVDIVARYGGDEFVILVPETELKPAIKLGERVLGEIKKNPFYYNGKTFPLSSSIGVACYEPNIHSAASLLKIADEALYQAKQKGRGCVVAKPKNSPISLVANL